MSEEQIDKLYKIIFLATGTILSAIIAVVVPWFLLKYILIVTAIGTFTMLGLVVYNKTVKIENNNDK